MKYISVCSGIEAASVAWQPLGWEAVAFAEIEAFPNAVLAHHFPHVPNLGDISQVDWRPYAGTVDLVVGGTPCQSFSVAGKREGMDGASGLVNEYFRLLSKVRPKLFLWENVPGVFSSGEWQDFPQLLREWAKLGYHVAWRVLDAQFFGVPQRRRRVFALGYLGNWQYPAKVLFESHSLCRHPAPRRKAREADPGGSAVGAYAPSGFGGFAEGVGVLRSNHDGVSGGTETLISGAVSCKWAKGTGGPAGDECYNLVCTHYGEIAGTLRARYDSSPCADNGQNIIAPISFCERGRECGRNIEYQNDIAYCLTNPGEGGRSPSRNIMDAASMVRRLTPTEAERLQGFPDCWTDIPYKGKPAPDGARYRALGNSMAVPCMAWIGKRIQMVEDGEL